MYPHTADKQAHSAADWAGEFRSAARWSTRSCGAHVWKKLRRRQRRAAHRSEGGTAPPTQGVTCDPQGARRSDEKRAGVASRLCAVPPFGDRCPGQRQEESSATPSTACHAVCAPSFSSRTFFQYGRFTAAREPTC
ncbi:mucin-associated surface protein (MASP) [Trypanosoma cruzi]|nr:mucin-associated surface protein (MASP) [Trypanosoma cruzi]